MENFCEKKLVLSKIVSFWFISKIICMALMSLDKRMSAKDVINISLNSHVKKC